MTRANKVRERILLGGADANIDFADLRRVLLSLGFTERIKGSHHIFTHPGVVEIVNIQPKGALSKPYQVKQIRNIILRYNLKIDDD